MKILKNTSSIIIILIITVLASHAGDTSSSSLIGFSMDGRYVAFERFGTYDGSGFPYHEIFIINVNTNNWTVKPIYTMNRDDEGGEGLGDEKSASRKNYRKAFGILKKYNIIKGNVGRELTVGSRGDDWQKKLNFKVKKETYQLLLKEIDTGKDCYGLGTAKIIKLILISRNKERVLQQDTNIPKSRECPLIYSIKSAYIYKNRIIVFIEYQKPGFEGPDTRQIAVTGKIN